MTEPVRFKPGDLVMWERYTILAEHIINVEPKTPRVTLGPLFIVLANDESGLRRRSGHSSFPYLMFCITTGYAWWDGYPKEKPLQLVQGIDDCV